MVNRDLKRILLPYHFVSSHELPSITGTEAAADFYPSECGGEELATGDNLRIVRCDISLHHKGRLVLPRSQPIDSATHMAK